MRPDYCAVDHLQAGVAVATVVEHFEQQLSQVGQRPEPKLAINPRPLAKMLVQIAPGNARPRNPENPVKNKAMIPRTTPAARAAFDHEWRKTVSFLITLQITAASSKDTVNQKLPRLRTAFVNTS